MMDERTLLFGAPLALLLASCLGQSGEEPGPPCRATEVLTVSDPSLPIEGRETTPAEFLAATVGSWRGTFDGGPFDGAGIALDVEAESSVQVVMRTGVEGMCPPVYSVAVRARIASDGLIDQELTGEIGEGHYRGQETELSASLGPAQVDARVPRPGPDATDGRCSSVPFQLFLHATHRGGADRPRWSGGIGWSGMALPPDWPESPPCFLSEQLGGFRLEQSTP